MNGSIPTTSRPSTIIDPYYYVDRTTLQEVNQHNQALAVMAVDNLPNELPRDASESFGEQMMEFVLPDLLKNYDQPIIKNAIIAEDGDLTEKYAYLRDYLNGT